MGAAGGSETATLRLARNFEVLLAFAKTVCEPTGSVFAP